MEVEIWSGDWGLPSVDFNCLRVLALLRFSGVQAEIQKSNNPFGTLDGSLPVFKHHKVKLTKFQDILDYLRTKNYCPDLNLNAVQLAESLAYRIMIEEKLDPALRYIVWIDEKNYLELTRPWYAKVLPIPFNYYYPGRYKRDNERVIRSLYPNMEENDIQFEIYREAEKCLTCLSNRLGECEYFYGNHPSSLDAVVYSCLAPLLKASFPSAVLQNHAKASTNLVKFVVRITQKYFPRDLQEYECEKEREKETNAKKSSADFLPHKRRNQILATLFAVAAFFIYGVTSGIFSISISRLESERAFEYEDDEDVLD